MKRLTPARARAILDVIHRGFAEVEALNDYELEFYGLTDTWHKRANEALDIITDIAHRNKRSASVS